MRTISIVVLCAMFALDSHAAQRKTSAQIDTDAMTSETQATAPCGDNCMNLIWWIPQEFWTATLEKDATIIEKDKEAFLKAFQPYSILAVCQANINSLGSFEYYSEAMVRKGLYIFIVDEGGKQIKITPLDDFPSDVEVILGLFKPILKAAMGRLGENFHFYVLPDRTASGTRLIDPYLAKTLSVQLLNSNQETIIAEIQMPLDCLFVSRICPNGRKAHISWRFCPWTGKQLDN